MYLTIPEIKTHLYNEVVKEITRVDDSIIQFAIDAAIDEAKGYLSAYDVDKIFSAEGSNRNNVLLLFVKDIAVWHFIQLANPAVDMQLRYERYKKAIEWLDKVQRGSVVPDLPQPPPPENENNFIKWGSNRKRGNYF